MSVSARIEIGLRAMLGKQIIQGLRMAVEQMLPQLRPDAGENDLLHSCLRLDTEDIRTAITYAADRFAHKGTMLVPPKRQIRFL